MSRSQALAHAREYFDSGSLYADLARRVAYRTESQEKASAPLLRSYLADELAPAVARMQFTSRIIDNPAAGHGPMLFASRDEDASLPTALVYGHGDVVRGYDDQWRRPLSPWTLTAAGDRWYGRGTADNKGQHSIVLGALASALAARGGRLGCNVRLLIETGEEVGSPGLHTLCSALAQELAADLLIASDGPRVNANRPTLFLGSRGSINFDLVLALREGGHHSGNWGGLLRNPATVLANAIASMVGRDGVILVEGLRPPPIPEDVRRALADIAVGGDPGDPSIDDGWGEPGLSAAERVFGWNTLEVLALKSGNAERPVNAIPPAAIARCQLRFVVGTDWRRFADHLRGHLAARGFAGVEVVAEEGNAATRLSPDDPWVLWAAASIERSTGKKPAILPNLGGTLPNDAFAELLGLPTLWVPHSYPGCSQHAADEHLLASVAREGLQIMAGLFWDLGEPGAAPATLRRRSPKGAERSSTPVRR
ncbi:MAG TPA: M20 family metallopeptidase [Casimicrobiaceae bacterium]|nr:M20 family metallopeptidase [Casimicrobiaceae bacterium]